MFYLHADVTIESELPLAELAVAVASALSTPPLVLDTSGDYDDDEVYSCTCFGMDFELAKDDPPQRGYHLTVNSNVDQNDFDGSEREIDGVQYILALLKRGGLVAAVRDPKLLYG